MTLKKINKIGHQGQAIFEYFILTAVVITAVLFFADTAFFRNIRNSCSHAFNEAVEEILR